MHDITNGLKLIEAFLDEHEGHLKLKCIGRYPASWRGELRVGLSDYGRKPAHSHVFYVVGESMQEIGLRLWNELQEWLADNKAPTIEEYFGERRCDGH